MTDEQMKVADELRHLTLELNKKLIKAANAGIEVEVNYTSERIVAANVERMCQVQCVARVRI